MLVNVECIPLLVDEHDDDDDDDDDGDDGDDTGLS